MGVTCRYCQREAEGRRWEAVCRDCRTEIAALMDDPVDFEGGGFPWLFVLAWIAAGSLLGIALLLS